MMMLLAMIMIIKCLLPAIDFATRYSTRYSDFSSQPYLNPTRSKKKPTRWGLLMNGVPKKKVVCKEVQNVGSSFNPSLIRGRRMAFCAEHN